MQIKFSVRNLDRFQVALQRSPLLVAQEVNSLLVRSGAMLRRTIQNNPWKVGAQGGGAPVDTGTLRDSHRQTISRFALTIRPSTNYAKYVHDGTAKMRERPWLAYAITQNEQGIEKEANKMMDRIANKLAI